MVQFFNNFSVKLEILAIEASAVFSCTIRNLEAVANLIIWKQIAIKQRN